MTLGCLSASAQGLMRDGWRGHIYGGQRLEIVYDPNSVATIDVDPVRDWREGVQVFFMENSTAFRKDEDTTRSLALLETTFYNTDILSQIDYVVVTAAASPGGVSEDNERLAAARALAIKKYLMEMFPYLNRDRFVTYSAGEDWMGLKQMIEQDQYVPGRASALRLLSAPLRGEMIRERLKIIGGGETYEHVAKHMFPKLGGGSVFIIYKYKTPVQSYEPAPAYTPAPASYNSNTYDSSSEYTPTPGFTPSPDYTSNFYEPDPEPAPAPAPEVKVKKAREPKTPKTAKTPRIKVNAAEGDSSWDLKTNVLYLATASLNLGVEAKLGEHWSIDVPFNYNGWDMGKYQKWRHIMVQPEGRYWLGEAMKSGHFFGLHGHWAMYNLGSVGFNDHMKTHRYQGNLMGVGVSYGYRWNFRNSRWGMEATLGAGYTQLKYDKYGCADCLQEIADESEVTKGFMGPTKVGFSLVYRIGNKVTKSK